MAYEIDFIGVRKDLAKKDADAIAIRWKENDDYKVVVYDGGLQAHGEALVRHLNEYYFNNSSKKVIDAVILSHGDQDHAIGLKSILENFEVKKLYMNIPWLYKEELYPRIKDKRITRESLEARLRESFPHISELEKIALEKNILIQPIFAGAIVENKLIVLSPCKAFYLNLVVEAVDYLINKSTASVNEAKELFESLKMRVSDVFESWGIETLRENVVTSPANEMSAIVLGEMDEENFLLVGDAGIRALNNAMYYAENTLNVSLEKIVNCMQVPHHGGRRNVSPSLLNRLLGNIVEKTDKPRKIAYVSSAEDSDHPYKMVVNAFIRRGRLVYKTGGCTLWHHINMPNRNWNSAKNEEFSKCVEKWDD